MILKSSSNMHSKGVIIAYCCSLVRGRLQVFSCFHSACMLQRLADVKLCLSLQGRDSMSHSSGMYYTCTSPSWIIMRSA